MRELLFSDDVVIVGGAGAKSFVVDGIALLLREKLNRQNEKSPGVLPGDLNARLYPGSAVKN